MFWKFRVLFEAKHYQGRFSLLFTSVSLTDAAASYPSFLQHFRHLVHKPLCALYVARAAVFPPQLSLASEIVVSEHARWTVSNHDYATGHTVYFFFRRVCKTAKMNISFVMSVRPSVPSSDRLYVCPSAWNNGFH
jgi:hypothetical protein